MRDIGVRGGVSSALLVLAIALGACEQAGTLEGVLEVQVIDTGDGESRTRYLLNVGDGRRDLLFRSDPFIPPGTLLRVWGDDDGARVTVAGFEAGPEEIPRALIGAPPFPRRKVAFVLVDLGAGVNLTVEEARKRAFGTEPADRSMKQVMLEYSFGRQDLEGDVIGPLKYTMSGCNYDNMDETLRPMIPGTYDNYVWYFGNRVSGCGFAGVAGLGRVGSVSKNLWLNGTASCRVASHEFGHNLGLQHAARLRCGTTPFHDVPGPNCRSSEYGDSNDVMGDGCNHVNGYSKAYLRWFEGCNGVQVRSSGTFTIFPVEGACNAVQVLQIPMAKPRQYQNTMLQNYVLELRAPLGLDAGLGPVVNLRVATNVGKTGSAKMTWILDTKPETTALDGLKAGEEFTDPAGGVRFRVEAIDATQATIKVELPEGLATGPSVCLDDSALSTATPSCAQAPPPVTGGADAGGNPGRPDGGGAAPRIDSGVEAGTAPKPDAAAKPDGAAPPVMSSPDAGSAVEDPASPAGQMQSVAGSGCSCRMGAAAGSPSRAGLAMLMLLLALLARTRRR